ncbi:MAG TPA: zf-HC2 domain-containing protein [Geminicoccaceae bacterium]|nr:zf-HC2 domain-containing protein [Geminicoccaceae bacterium]
MQCSDLERYLEAYLDLRLGRSRSAILRRHLAACPACRGRVEGLRHFERDLQRRFRSMERAHSVWNGLEPDLVRSVAGGEPALPPRELTLGRLRALPSPGGDPAPSLLPTAGGVRPGAGGAAAGRRRWGKRLVGIVLITAALGTLASPLHSWFLGDQTVHGPVQAYVEFLKGDYPLGYETSDPSSLQSWLEGELGPGFTMPPTPSSFELAGGRVDRPAGGAVVAVAYLRDGLPTLLFIQSRAAGTADQGLVGFHAGDGLGESYGFNQLAWEGGDVAFTVVSPLPQPVLAEFAREISGASL